MRLDHRGGNPVVAVYRRLLLPPSETFVRSDALALSRYRAVFVGQQRQRGLKLPRGRVLIGTPGGRRQRAVRRRLPGYDPDARLVRACRARRVRLVHAHFGPDAVGALTLSRALEVPLVVTFWGFDATMTDEALLAMGGDRADYVGRRSELFGEAAKLLAVSRFIADELLDQGAPETKLAVHHVGVPLGAPPEPAERDPVVLFVGRHVEKKGIGDLIEAMARVRVEIPGARLVVAGDGPLRPHNESRARELGLDAEFLGWLGADDVGERMGRVRVLCVPSKRAANGDAEGLPTVIPEAGAQGLPVVGTRHSGIPEAIGEDRGGLLADEGDIEGIARQLIAVLGDDALWRRLSRGAYDNIERNFDPARQAAELEGIYDEILNR